ncbi:MAG: DUF4344 domain-containing metallopeptidase [Tahibacter sp.]
MRTLVLLVLLSCAMSAHARFVVQKTKLESDQYTELSASLKEQHVLQGVATELNKTIDTPTKVSLRFAECGEANSFYDPTTQVVTMCLELIESAYESVRAKHQTAEQLDDAAASVFVFFLFHEIGHALIHVLDIPITGKEEDAADQLSAWLLIDDEDGDKTALDAATSFYFDSQADGDADETAFADEHSLNKQRYFNILCWVYGSNPDAHADLVSDDELPEARAEQCAGEYQRLDKSWRTLLSEHIKK